MRYSFIKFTWFSPFFLYNFISFFFVHILPRFIYFKVHKAFRTINFHPKRNGNKQQQQLADTEFQNEIVLQCTYVTMCVCVSVCTFFRLSTFVIIIAAAAVYSVQNQKCHKCNATNCIHIHNIDGVVDCVWHWIRTVVSYLSIYYDFF